MYIIKGINKKWILEGNIMGGVVERYGGNYRI